MLIHLYNFHCMSAMFSNIVSVLWFSLCVHMVAMNDEQLIETDADFKTGDGRIGGPGKPEDSIPVIEVRGEGKPMSAAQIRALEEEAAGKPLDIKVKHTWRPSKCPRAAKRKDFVTFHYKAYTEDFKKYDQTYERQPIRMQVGVGMTMPGLDKGLRGMCDTELRKLTIPYRLSRKGKSKVWKRILNDEHWLVFDIEMLQVEPWSAQLQFDFMDLNNNTYLSTNELVRFAEKMQKEFGKRLPNEDIDNVILAEYYIKYFDANGDNKVDSAEFASIIQRDMISMGNTGKKTSPEDGRKRDPGLGWVLDFDGDGIVSRHELDEAVELLEREPRLKPRKREEL